MDQRSMSTKSIMLWMGAVLAVTVVVVAVAKLAGKEPAPANAVSTTLPALSDDDWKIGAETGTVTLIEYSDFQCPACGFYFPLVERLVTDYKDTVQFVYRHFPLPQHAQARPAAYAAEAAGKQGKFWEMYRLLFEHQSDWSEKRDAETIFEGYASDLGLDLVRYRKDRDDAAAENKVQADYQGGVRAEVNSTPTFFLDGVKLRNPTSYEEFKSLIDAKFATSS